MSDGLHCRTPMPALALPQPNPGFEMIVSRPGMSQGLAQTDGIQLFPRAFLQVGAVRIGGQWRYIDSPIANGVGAVYISTAHKIGQLQVEGVARYRFKTGAKGPADPTAWEFSLNAKRSFGSVGLRFDSDYSPDEFGRGPSLWLQAGPTIAIGKWTQISANVGRRERNSDPDYTAFNAGISRVLAKPLTIDLRYYATDRREFGERYRGRIVLSARAAL